MGFEAIDQLLNDAVADGRIHGVAAMVVGRDGVLYEGAAGDATLDTLFRNASMTKAVATTAALQLVEQGRLDLDATIDSVLPEFAEMQVLAEDGTLRAPASMPTFRQLMTHTSGLGYFFTNQALLEHCAANGVPSILDGLKVALKAPMVHDPGTMWEYGVSVDWLGLAVEKLTGRTLGEQLAETVYGPLGMTDSTFAPSDEARANLLPVKARMADGTLADTPLDLPAVQEWDAGGHGSYGTIRDYGRFVQAWLNDGAGILRPETVDLALQDHIEGIPMPEMIRTAVPELSNDVPALPVPQGWGLGFHLTKVDLPGMRSAGTADWAGLFNSYYWIDRSAGVAGILMTQILPFFDGPVVETLLAFESAVYAEVGAAAPIG